MRDRSPTAPSSPRPPRLSEPRRWSLHEALAVKKLTSSSAQTYRELFKLNRPEVNRIGTVAMTGNDAEAPRIPDSDDVLTRCMLIDETMLTRFGEVENPAKRLAIKCSQYENMETLKQFRRSFLLTLLDHYSDESPQLGDILTAARQNWMNKDEPSTSDDKIERKPVKVDDAEGGVVHQTLSDGPARLVKWMKRHIKPHAGSHVRISEVDDAIKTADPDVCFRCCYR